LRGGYAIVRDLVAHDERLSRPLTRRTRCSGRLAR
jgi:hypothetical protein